MRILACLAPFLVVLSACDGGSRTSPAPPQPSSTQEDHDSAQAESKSPVIRALADPDRLTHATLHAKYGPQRYSQDYEEYIIRDFFQDRRGGVFLDVGAYHYRRLSNTYFLERNLGWSGIAVDALERFRAGYERHRPRTQFFAFFVSDKSDEKAAFYILNQRDNRSTAARSIADEWEPGFEETEVPTITLDDLLESLAVERIDFLTMDIELWEPQALAGFDIERYRPQLVCIEAHAPSQDQLLQYFGEHGYGRIDKYRAVDSRNWYFTPIDTAAQEGARDRPE